MLIRYPETLERAFSCVYSYLNIYAYLCYMLDIDESLIDGGLSFTSLKKVLGQRGTYFHTQVV